MFCKENFVRSPLHVPIRNWMRISSAPFFPSKKREEKSLARGWLCWNDHDDTTWQRRRRRRTTATTTTNSTAATGRSKIIIIMLREAENDEFIVWLFHICQLTLKSRRRWEKSIFFRLPCRQRSNHLGEEQRQENGKRVGEILTPSNSSIKRVYMRRGGEEVTPSTSPLDINVV